MNGKDLFVKIAVKQGMLAIVSYLFNTPKDQMVRDVYGEDIHPNYFNEKLQLFCDSPIRAIGFLDDEHRDKLFDAALRYHVSTFPPGGEERADDSSKAPCPKCHREWDDPRGCDREGHR